MCPWTYMDDVPKVECGECCLRHPCFSLHNLINCKGLLEQKKRSYTPDLMCLHLNCCAVLFSSCHICVIDDGSDPVGSGILADLYLTCCDEEITTVRAVLFCSTKIISNSSHSSSWSLAKTESFLKTYLKMRESGWLPIHAQRWWHRSSLSHKRLCNSLTLLIMVRTKRKQVLRVRSPSDHSFKGS